MHNLITFPIVPRAVVHDVTEIDLAAQIRRGDVTYEEIARRFENVGFADWMERQGLKIYRLGVVGPHPAKPETP